MEGQQVDRSGQDEVFTRGKLIASVVAMAKHDGGLENIIKRNN